MKLDKVSHMAQPYGLDVLGVVPADKSHGCLVLFGPAADFWTVFSASSEGLDGQINPVDRWSTRVFEQLSKETGARALLPFGGPPYAPFLTYAQQSGRAWLSHVGMLVHDTQGLLISYRGALEFDHDIADLSVNSARPCDDCLAKPCANACPVDALNAGGYDVEKCKSYLRTPEGTDCLNKGCAVRRICPISKGANRSEQQSALHMRAFVGA